MTKDIRDKLWEITWDNDRALPVDAEPRQIPMVGELHLAIAEIDRLRDEVATLTRARNAAIGFSTLWGRKLGLLRATHRIIYGGEDPKVWQHVKRGSLYVEIGTATVQLSGEIPITEGETLVIYRGEAGALWARRTSEFRDGRFIEPRTEELEP